MVRNPYDESPEAKEWAEYVEAFREGSPILPNDNRETFVMFLMTASTATLRWVLTTYRLFDIMDPEDPASDTCYKLISNELELRDADYQGVALGN